jgi:hypothetical protein
MGKMADDEAEAGATNYEGPHPSEALEFVCDSPICRFLVKRACGISMLIRHLQGDI